MVSALHTSTNGLADCLFLHTGWRTAGTWLWSRMRDLPGIMGFYEPLNEILGSITPDTVRQISADSWQSRHPKRMRPYFEEYEPLLAPDRSGVPLFRPEFVVGNYFMNAEQDDPTLAAYLASLISYAHNSGAVPVFKFVRSAGRISWMRRQFPTAAHVAMIRNPVSQFASCWHQFSAAQESFFVGAPFAVLSANQANHRVASMLDALGIRLPTWSLNDLTSLKLAASAYAATQSPFDCYRVFLAFWLLSATSIPADISLMIESEALLFSGPAIRGIATRLEEIFGFVPDLEERSTKKLTELGPRPVVLPIPSGDIWQLHCLAMAQIEPDFPHAQIIRSSLAGGTLLTLDYATVWPQNAAKLMTIQTIEARAKEAEARANEANATLKQVTGSRSWKLTAPLRRLTAALAG